MRVAVGLALASAIFLSGAAGLIFQIVWFYRAGLVLGNSLWAATLVLSSFMGGLALGNALAGALGPRVRNLVRAYAALEATIAVAGLLATLTLPRLTALVVPLAQHFPEGTLGAIEIRLLAAFLVLAAPTTAMGATLPVLVGALTRQGRVFGATLGRLYGVNTFGAVLGVLAAELVFINRLGVAGSAWVASGFNVAACGLALWAGGRMMPGSITLAPRTHADGLPARRTVFVVLLTVAALAGMLLLALEIVWFRFLTLYVLSTTLAASLMLAAVLAGIGLGGLLGGRWARHGASASGQAPVVAAMAGCAVVASYVAFDVLTSGTQIGDWRLVTWMALVLTLPTSLASGVLFTLLGESVHRHVSQGARAAAWLTLANTVGALAGAPLATFLLLPRLGMERSFVAIAGAYGVVMLGLIAVLRPLPRGARWTLPPALLALVIALSTFPRGAMQERYFTRAADAYAADGSKVIATREGPSETIFLMRQDLMGQPVYHRLVTNGFSMTGTAVPGLRYMRYFAYWPMFAHHGPIARALVVCYGVGVTAGAVLDIPSLTSLDIVEISRDVVSMSDAIYPAERHPLRDPRAKVHFEDGRYFLETTSERFDLITGEPPPPRTPGTSNIYTREYFQLIHDRLNEGGVTTYWLPVGRPDPGTDVDTIVRAFCDVFADCALWNATPFDFMLTGSRHGGGAVSMEQLSAPWQDPKLVASLREIGFERPEQIASTFLGDAAYLRDFTANTPPLTDDFPQRLEPVSGRPSLSDPAYATSETVRRHYQEVLDPARSAAVFRGSAYIRALWPARFVASAAPYFDVQRLTNDILWDGSRPLAHVDGLDTLLTSTTLRTLPLWFLGSDEIRQRIVETAPTDTATADYGKGLRALTGRDYDGAVSFFLRAANRGLNGSLPWLAYSLARSGRTAEAAGIAAKAQPSTDDERYFWRWMGERFQ